ncbi:MAG TPA: isoprenylcysteine carboxylmethyltransferase family protein [Candidatus Dormibacteraeota bacterium]
MDEGARLRSFSLGFDAKPLRAHLDDIRFLVFGRALPAVFFGVITWNVLHNLLSLTNQVLADVTFVGVLALLPTALYLLFCAIPVGVYLTRPRPRARDGRLIARAAGLLGTTALLIVGILGGPVLYQSPWGLQLAAVCLEIVAFTLGVWGLLTLRRNLSIIPEARGLVTSGPYHFIRHPLYTAEILAAITVVVAHPALWAVVGIIPFIALQLARATFEEGLLRQTFPAYATYIARTPRLVPGVW